MYRPQFPYITPSGCQDQRCPYSFDLTNTPALTGSLPAGQSIHGVPLPIDKDADYYLRGVQSSDLGLGFQFRLEDPLGHPLSDTDNVLNTINFEFPALYSATDGAGIVALDSDDWGIFCQKGSVLKLYLNNNSTNAVDLTQFVITLHGVKRYSGEMCR
jgi:hypothetical protein